MFSFDAACTATPVKLGSVAKQSSLLVQDDPGPPLRMPLSEPPTALAVTLARAADEGLGVLCDVLATPTPAATPTKPPATEPATATSPVASEALTSTLPPEFSVTPVPV